MVITGLTRNQFGVTHEGSNPSLSANKKRTFVYQDKGSFFELSVPCGTISTPSVREAMLRIVKCLRAWVAHLTSLCAKAQYFTAALPLLHLGEAKLHKIAFSGIT